MVARKRKPVMRIGMAGRNVTYKGNYRVNWGKTGNAYNRQSRGFSSRKQAIAFKNMLIRKFKKNNKIDYIYMSD